MPAQRFLALAYVAGTAILAALAAGVSVSSGALFAWFLGYWLVMAPTPVVGASLAFRNLANPLKEFARVRLWGTIGWMVAGWFVSGLMAQARFVPRGRGPYEAFWVAAALSVVLAAYSLTLPHTPPLAVGGRTGSGLRAAVAMLRRREISVFLGTAFGVCLTTPFIYQVLPTHLESRGLPRAWISTALTLGQVPEIAALAVLLDVSTDPVPRDPGGRHRGPGSPIHEPCDRPAALGGPGGDPAPGHRRRLLHDRRASVHGQPRPGRASRRCQAILTVLTSGLGSLLGSVLAGETSHHLPKDSSLVFLIPCLIDGGLLVYFWACFRPDHATTPRVDTNDEARP